MGSFHVIRLRVTPAIFFSLFPRLDPNNGNWVPASPPDYGYNCIGWAAGDDRNWWQPSGAGGDYWPPGAPLAPTLEAYRIAFETLGYSVCSSGDVEAGYEKVAIFVDALREPTHAARQRPDGQWTSKLGEGIDINHDDPDAVGGGTYGEVALFLRRPVKEGST